MAPSKLAEPVTLPCGLTLPNRLAKAATTEQMADSSKLPTKQMFHRAYRSWAEGGWGMVLTGNVQVDLRYLGAFQDTAIDLHQMSEDHVHAAYRSLAETCNKEGTPTIMQINHTGRQSPLGAGTKGYCEKALAPSAVPIDFGPGLLQRIIRNIVFGTPREMTKADIEDAVQRFATAARIASETGFAGVEIHAAHGYLLAQFLSARTNLRNDEYGGSARARAKIVVDVIKAIREVVPQGFAVGIKLNSVDHQYGSGEGQEKSSELDDVLEQTKIIAEAGIDFLELSGGSYENPVMLQSVDDVAKLSARTRAREAFFIDFAHTIRKSIPDVVLMVTGGFRSRKGMQDAVLEGACDIIGLARPAVLEPGLPKDTILNDSVPDEKAKVEARNIATPWILKQLGVRSVGAGYESAWYSRRMRKMGLPSL